MPNRTLVIPYVCLTFFLAATGNTQEIETKNSAEVAVRQAIDSYVEAFNQRDAAKLAAHWSEDGVYVSRDSGDQVVGRTALTKEFSSMLAGAAVPQLAIATESIEFVSPNVALERGVATVTQPDGNVFTTDYSVVFVKREGLWLIDRVTEETRTAEAVSNYEHLKALEWMVGEWIDQEKDFTITTVCKWTRNRNYLSRMFQVEVAGEVASSGMQVIGWDPQKKQVHSWLFDSDGGFVKGIWTQKKDRWIVQSVAVLADGGSGSFTSIFRPIDADSFGWQKVNQTMDGELLANLDEVIVSRAQK